MLKWNDVLDYARNGNPAPDRKIHKTDDEWRELVNAEVGNAPSGNRTPVQLRDVLTVQARHLCLRLL